MQIDIAYIVLVLVVVLMSMTLHEAMHAYASNWLGDDTAKAEGRLTLNPIAHIDPFLTLALPLFLAVIGAPIFGGAKPVPFNPMRVRYGEFGAAIVGVAGPLTNFALAFIFFAIYAVSGVSSGVVADFLTLAVIVNLGFFIFNMLPIPPLDGSRLLYAIAPDGARNVMAKIEQNGLILILALVFLFSSQIGQIISTATAAILKAFSLLFGLQ